MRIAPASYAEQQSEELGDDVVARRIQARVRLKISKCGDDIAVHLVATRERVMLALRLSS